MPSPDLFDADALLDRLIASAKDPYRPVVFLVGSALTAPTAPDAPGVPNVDGMIERIRHLLGRSDVPDPDAPNPYQDAFQTLLAHRGPETVNHLVRGAVLAASNGHEASLVDAALEHDAGVHQRACEALEDALDGWHPSPGVDYLGRLVARSPQHFGRTVLTSNFDPLIEVSCRRAGRPCWRTMLHGDGEITAGQSDACHVVHVHGYWYGTDTLHLPNQLEAPRPKLRTSLRRLFEDVILVVVAYGGWDDVFTRALFDAVAEGGAFPEVIWTFYGSDPEHIRSGSSRLLENLRPGLERGRVTLYGGVDCHRFFRDLYERLETTGPLEPGVIAPALGRGASPPAERSKRRSPFVVGSPIERDEDFYGRFQQRDILRDAVDRCQPVQILGERRMGKTSMLKWVERHAPQWQERPVAWVNAQGLGGHSPQKLVREVAWSLARTSEADDGRFGDGSRGAVEVLRELLPLVLLVDEASALAEPGHGFDTDFLGALRAFGQERQLLWISTSHQDLQGLFRETGLASNFLNDSRQVWVGQLEAEAARELLAPVDDEVARERILEEAGGFGLGLQWLGDAWTRDSMDWDAARDAYAEAMEPYFQRWWDGRSSAVRKLLKRGLSGMDLEGLTGRERRRARLLESQGLLVEARGCFRLSGPTWRAFVKEV